MKENMKMEREKKYQSFNLLPCDPTNWYLGHIESSLCMKNHNYSAKKTQFPVAPAKILLFRLNGGKW